MHRLTGIRLSIALVLIGGCGARSGVDPTSLPSPELTSSQARFFDSIESLRVALNGSSEQRAAASELVLNGNQMAITQCMKVEGFDYLGPQLSIEPTDPFYEGGWEARPDEEFAKRWGFGIFTHDYVPPTMVVNPAYEALDDEAKLGYDAALDKCVDSPDANQGYGFGGQELWFDLRNRLSGASMSDDFAGERHKYASCMRDVGYTIANANEVVDLALDVAILDTHLRDYVDGSPEKAKAIEEGIVNQRVLAVADVRCRLAQAEAITEQLSPVLENWLSLHQAEVDKVAAQWAELG